MNNLQKPTPSVPLMWEAVAVERFPLEISSEPIYIVITKSGKMEVAGFVALSAGIWPDVTHVLRPVTVAGVPTDEEFTEWYDRGYCAAIEEDDPELVASPDDVFEWMRSRMLPLIAEKEAMINHLREKVSCKCTCANSLEYSNCNKNCERIVADNSENHIPDVGNMVT